MLPTSFATEVLLDEEECFIDVTFGNG